MTLLLQVNELSGLEPALCKSSLGIPRAKNISIGTADTSETYWISKDLLALVKLDAAIPKFIQPNSAVHFSKSTDQAQSHAAQAQRCTHAGSEWLHRNQPRTGASPEPELIKSRGSKLIQQS